MPRMDVRRTRVMERPTDLITLPERSTVRVPAEFCEDMSGDDVYGTIIDIEPEGTHWITTSFGLYALTQADLMSDRVEVID